MCIGATPAHAMDRWGHIICDVVSDLILIKFVVLPLFDRFFVCFQLRDCVTGVLPFEQAFPVPKFLTILSIVHYETNMFPKVPKIMFFLLHPHPSKHIKLTFFVFFLCQRFPKRCAPSSPRRRSRCSRLLL